MKFFITTISISVLLTGCFTMHPSTHEYTILPSYTPSKQLTQSVNATLKLSSTRSIASLASTQFYYLKGSSTIGAYVYSRWADTPSTMIDRAVYSSLQNQELFSTLVSSTSNVTADLLLESDLNAFYHRFYDDSTSEGFIDITYRLINPKTKTTIATKRFIIIEPSPSKDAKGGVVALNQATHELSNQCIAWLNTSIKDSTWKK